MSECSTENLMFLARQAEAAERFQDMIHFMKQLVDLRLKAVNDIGDTSKLVEWGKTASKDEKAKIGSGPLNQDERNLFSVAYKNVVGTLRNSWRVLADENTVSEFADNKESVALVQKLKANVAQDIHDTCHEIQDILTELADTTKKIKDAKLLVSKDAWVFYKKMQGDYFRYLREVFKEKDEFKTHCESHYKAAMDAAKEELAPTDPTRLGLALNFSVCHYEILENATEACKLAKEAFDNAIEKLDSLNDVSYKDSTLIMQLLRDNLTIWSTPDEDQ